MTRGLSMLFVAFAGSLSGNALEGNSKGNLRGNRTTTTKAPPNLIMLIVDDLGWGDVGFHASDFKTPNMDKLAASGVRLEQYYVSPFCSPTRTSLLTGMYAHHAGMQGVIPVPPGTRASIPMKDRTMASKLKDHGYSTHYIGKWHLGYPSWQNTPIGRGFDSFLGSFGGALDVYSKVALSGGAAGYDYWNQTAPTPDCTALESAIEVGECIKASSVPLMERVGSGNFITSVPEHYIEFDYREEVHRVISQSRGKPFFMVFASQLIHDPLQRAPDWKANAACENVSMNPADLPETIYTPCDSWDTSCHTITEARQSLCTMVHYIDGNLGVVADEVEKAGLWDNTLIWVTTDNGGKMIDTIILAGITISEGSGSSNFPLRSGKGTHFEGGIRGVSFLTGGLVPAQPPIYELLMHVDVPYTMMTLAGLDLSQDHLDGYDVWDVITKGAPSPRQEVPVHMDNSELLHTFMANLGRLDAEPHRCKNPEDCQTVTLMKKIDGSLFKLINGANGGGSFDGYSHNDNASGKDYNLILTEDLYGNEALRTTFCTDVVDSTNPGSEKGTWQCHPVYFFNLTADPRETTNLAHKATQNNIYGRLIENMLVDIYGIHLNPEYGYVQPVNYGRFDQEKHDQAGVMRLLMGPEEAALPQNQPERYQKCPEGDEGECQGFWAPWLAKPPECLGSTAFEHRKEPYCQ